jgi:hypothetical protein
MTKNEAAKERFSFRWGVQILDEGWTDIPNIFLRNYSKAGVTRFEFLLIVHLASYRFDKEGSESHPSLTTLSEQTGWTTQRIWQIVVGLEKKGMLTRTQRPGKTTIYDFTGFSEAVLAAVLVGDKTGFTPKADFRGTPKANFRTPLKPALHDNRSKKKKKEENHVQPESPTVKMCSECGKPIVTGNGVTLKDVCSCSGKAALEEAFGPREEPAAIGPSPAEVIVNGMCTYNGNSRGIDALSKKDRLAWVERARSVCDEYHVNAGQAKLAWAAYALRNGYKSSVSPFYQSFDSEIGPLLAMARDGDITTDSLRKEAQGEERRDKGNGAQKPKRRASDVSPEQIAEDRRLLAEHKKKREAAREAARTTSGG